MLARIWRTQVDPAHEEEYVRFTEEYSLPMFQQQPGCLGVLFLNTPSDWGALSFWDNDAAVTALADSASYLDTVRRLEETGLLIGTSSVEVFAVHGGFVRYVNLGRGNRES